MKLGFLLVMGLPTAVLSVDSEIGTIKIVDQTVGNIYVREFPQALRFDLHRVEFNDSPVKSEYMFFLLAMARRASGDYEAFCRMLMTNEANSACRGGPESQAVLGGNVMRINKEYRVGGDVLFEYALESDVGRLVGQGVYGVTLDKRWKLYDASDHYIWEQVERTE